MRQVDLSRELKSLDRLADFMDSRFHIPGTGIRFGMDTAVGLIPLLGDMATFIPSAYLVVKAYQLEAGRLTLARMAGNVALDSIVGSIPLVGDLFDMIYKANIRNVVLLRDDLMKRRQEDGSGEWIAA